jgi:hypothetical protein
MGKNQDPGSGINIPDPQHWFFYQYSGISVHYRYRVADPVCLSRILIFILPGSRIQQRQQKRRNKQSIILRQFRNNCRTIPVHIIEKIVTTGTLSIIWVCDPGSEINLNRIPDPGGQKGTGSWIRIRNPANFGTVLVD